MAKDSWASMRDLAAQFFRHGGREEEERQLARLDADQGQAVAAFLKVSSLSRLTGALLSSESGTHRVLLMGKLLVCVG
ncbi:hypothetical protein ACIO02_30915 [Streptomyces sp. NPDC087568]|uniref:hypothetical protein n=1 Tax=Streptomyces sp. NPDC087568 TaxID=3365799 RepID=UPI003813206F